MTQHAILFGNPVEGFEIIGPFDSEATAIEYADRAQLGDWWLTVLYAPDADILERSARYLRSELAAIRNPD